MLLLVLMYLRDGSTTLRLYIKPEGCWQCMKTKDPFAKAGVRFDIVDPAIPPRWPNCWQWKSVCTRHRAPIENWQNWNG